MTPQDASNRYRERLERKMERVSRKLEELRDDDVQDALAQVLTDLDELDVKLASFAEEAQSEADAIMRERLAARRERLLAKQERLQLKLDLRQEMREQLENSLEDMQTQLQESLAQMQETIQSRVETSFSRGFPFSPPPPAAAAGQRLQEERRKILEMVQSGKVTADQAAQLLDALHEQDESARHTRRKPRWVRIRVTDTNEDKVRVNLTLPVGLVRAGLRAGGSIAGVQGLDTAGLEDMLNRGEIGHLLDIEDDKDGERIEIFVE